MGFGIATVQRFFGGGAVESESKQLLSVNEGGAGAEHEAVHNNSGGAFAISKKNAGKGALFRILNPAKKNGNVSPNTNADMGKVNAFCAKVMHRENEITIEECNAFRRMAPDAQKRVASRLEKDLTLPFQWSKTEQAQVDAGDPSENTKAAALNRASRVNSAAKLLSSAAADNPKIASSLSKILGENSFNPATRAANLGIIESAIKNIPNLERKNKIVEDAQLNEINRITAVCKSDKLTAQEKLKLIPHLLRAGAKVENGRRGILGNGHIGFGHMQKYDYTTANANAKHGYVFLGAQQFKSQGRLFKLAGAQFDESIQRVQQDATSPEKRIDDTRKALASILSEMVQLKEEMMAQEKKSGGKKFSNHADEVFEKILHSANLCGDEGAVQGIEDKIKNGEAVDERDMNIVSVHRHSESLRKLMAPEDTV